jgi:DNA-binding transcriptional ArsR family regulator
MITNEQTDQVFQALAHTTRREILDLVRDNPGQSVGELAQSFDVSRIAVMNHLAVLTTAGLIISEKDGRSRRLYLNAMPIREIHDRWIDSYSEQWLDRMSEIKLMAEAIAEKQNKR